MGTNGTEIRSNGLALEPGIIARIRASGAKIKKKSLVEPNLPPNLAKLVKMIDSANDKHTPHRFVTAFFQGDETTSVGKRLSELMSDLLMECLPRFVSSLCGTIIRAVEFHDGNAIDPDVCHVEVDAESRPILHSGYLFVEMPHERVVIRARREYEGRGASSSWIGVFSDKDASEFVAAWEAFARQHNYLKNRAFFPDGTLWNSSRGYTWDDVVLPADTLATIRRHTEEFLERRDALRRAGVKLRRGLMLEGPPGTGKTLACKVLAAQLNASLLWVTPRHVQSLDGFVEHLEVARYVSPTIVFLEDIDLYAEDREAGRSILLGELMGQLDGTTENDGLITVASTNRLQVVEQALRNRPGRFDRVIHFGALDAECRHRLLGRLLKNASLSEADRAFLVAFTDGYTGAQLEELTNTIQMLGIETAVGDCEPIRVDRPLIERALADIGTQTKNPIGFR